MSNKTIPFSVRLSPEDAEFIAELSIDHAKTVSDKIRAIIRKAREEAQRSDDETQSVRKLQNTLTTAVNRLHLEELHKGEHSELLVLYAEWLRQSSMVFVSILVSNEKETEKLNLNLLEKKIADSVFILFERFMRMGITERAPCYNPSIIRQKLAPILELADIINAQKVTCE